MAFLARKTSKATCEQTHKRTHENDKLCVAPADRPTDRPMFIISQRPWCRVVRRGMSYREASGQTGGGGGWTHNQSVRLAGWLAGGGWQGGALGDARLTTRTACMHTHAVDGLKWESKKRNALMRPRKEGEGGGAVHHQNRTERRDASHSKDRAYSSSADEGGKAWMYCWISGTLTRAYGMRW